MPATRTLNELPQIHTVSVYITDYTCTNWYSFLLIEKGKGVFVPLLILTLRTCRNKLGDFYRVRYSGGCGLFAKNVSLHPPYQRQVYSWQRLAYSIRKQTCNISSNCGHPHGETSHLYLYLYYIKTPVSTVVLVQKVRLNAHPSGRRARNTRWSYLISRTSCLGVFNIKYKLYICIYIFL
jgi:hypothetical protein